jgi:glyceraldehyde-3-phosphate dehydrogenase/erythrose-4-phosphate dehydrogenase
VVSFQLPSKPANVEYILESTADFQTWRNEVYVIEEETGKLYIGPPEPHRFYRVRMNVRREGCAA